MFVEHPPESPDENQRAKTAPHQKQGLGEVTLALLAASRAEALEDEAEEGIALLLARFAVSQR